MKRLLLFLLISTIVCAIVEESKEYDDVSLDFKLKPFRDIINKEKDQEIKATTKVTKPVKKEEIKFNKEIREITRIFNTSRLFNKPILVNGIEKMVKPSINTINKFEVPIKKMIDPAIKYI